MADKLSFGLKYRELAVEGDENHIIRIDTTDTGILARWEKTEAKLQELFDRIDNMNEAKKADGENGEEVPETEKARAMSREFDAIETAVEETVDALFNAEVSKHITAYYGALIRTVDGELLLVTVLNTLMDMYDKDIAKEMEKAQQKIKKHTAKYKK